MFTTLNVHINFVSNMQTKAEIRHFIAYKMIIIILMQNTLSHIIETSCWQKRYFYFLQKNCIIAKEMNKQTKHTQNSYKHKIYVWANDES